MNLYKNTYEPGEDTYLLLEQVSNYLKFNNLFNLNICEVGVGSGYIISNLIKNFPKNIFYGTDINPYAIKQTNENINNIITKIIIKQYFKYKLFNSNLLDEFIKQKIKLDLIIFNTPYLPLEDYEEYENLSFKDKAIYGGKKGYEIIEQFIYQINDVLNSNGKVIILYSSLSNHNYIIKILNRNLFEFKILKIENHFFEKLYCLEIRKSDLLKKILKHNISNLKYLTSGKHSKVLSGKYENGNIRNNIIIKIGLEQYIFKEIHYLKKLQKYDFVPKIYFLNKNYLIMEKIEGILIDNYIELKSKKEILIILQKILDICFKLDKLGIQKFELTNPYKHIIITKNNEVKFIDFERSIVSLSPKNITQILQYFKRKSNDLKLKDININLDKILIISKTYKLNNFRIIIDDIL